MGWPTYLQGLDRQELMDLVKTPDAAEQPLVAIVWDAMNDMTVKKHAGYFLRIEVVRSEAKQTKYRSLQPYMDPEAIKDYARPWKQIFASFVRTRARQDEGPVYARRIGSRRVRRAGRDRPGSSRSGSSNPAIGTSSSGRSSVVLDQATSIRLQGLKAAYLRFYIVLLVRE